VSLFRRGRGKEKDVDPVAWASEDNGAPARGDTTEDGDGSPGQVPDARGADPDAALFTPPRPRGVPPAGPRSRRRGRP
jgi:hypothetical protein